MQTALRPLCLTNPLTIGLTTRAAGSLRVSAGALLYHHTFLGREKMKLSDRKEMIREVFTDLELSEVRAALSDRYNTLTKMAKKEEEHGRRYDDRSWPRERLAILDGDGMRAGVIDVFNPRSADAKNGELFEDEDDDLEEASISSMVDRPNAYAEPVAPQYENTPDICPHTEILDETEEGGVPRFRCTLCGEGIRALAAPAGDSGDDDVEAVEADYEIVDERSEEERAQDPEPGPFVPIPPIPTLEDLDALTLEELGVPTRARNVLARRGIRTAADYIAAGDAVLRMPGVGEGTLVAINDALWDRGLTESAARQIEAQLVAQGRAFVGAMGGGETADAEELEEAPEDVQTSEDALPWEQVGMAFGNGKADEPEGIVVLDAMEWPEGPPEPGQRIKDLRKGSDSLPRELVIGAVDNRFVALAHPETGRPVGSLRVADVRWSPTLGCWAWGAPAAAGV